MVVAVPVTVTVTVAVAVTVSFAHVVVVTIMIMIITINVMLEDRYTAIGATANTRTDIRRIATNSNYCCRPNLRHKDRIAAAVGRDRV